MIGTGEVCSYLASHGTMTKRELNRRFKARGSTLAEMGTVLDVLVSSGEIEMIGISPYISYKAVAAAIT